MRAPCLACHEEMRDSLGRTLENGQAVQNGTRGGVLDFCHLKTNVYRDTELRTAVLMYSLRE